MTSSFSSTQMPIEFECPTGPLIEKLPHMDKWFGKLETRIHQDLGALNGRQHPPPIAEMQAWAASHTKFARSCLFITLSKNTCSIQLPTPTRNDRGISSIDSRCHTFIRVFRDLAHWCTQYKLQLPETQLAIYCCDTYAWEPEAHNFPWFVMAKPENRNGILIPDDSFVTHGLTRNESNEMISPDAPWAWTTALAQAKKIKGKTSGTRPQFFFKGSNTGATKWDVRGQLAKHSSSKSNVNIQLGRDREPWTNWAQYGALLDLPGNQPWSYRRKFLHLLGRPVIQIDVERFADKEDHNGTARWIQFYDALLEPSKQYAPFKVRFFDNDPPEEPPLETILATSLCVASPKKFSSKFSGRRVLSKLTTSHVLQYWYMTLWHYKLYFA